MGRGGVNQELKLLLTCKKVGWGRGGPVGRGFGVDVNQIIEVIAKMQKHVGGGGGPVIWGVGGVL